MKIKKFWEFRVLWLWGFEPWLAVISSYQLQLIQGEWICSVPLPEHSSLLLRTFQAASTPLPSPLSFIYLMVSLCIRGITLPISRQPSLFLIWVLNLLPNPRKVIYMASLQKSKKKHFKVDYKKEYRLNSFGLGVFHFFSRINIQKLKIK